MEMELLYSRALDMNGGVDYSDEDGENSIYKQKYERAMKELEFTKRRLQQQHEDDMEQLIGLKKQLEKKVGCYFCLMLDALHSGSKYKKRNNRISKHPNSRFF